MRARKKKTNSTLNLLILKKKSSITKNISKVKLFFVIAMIRMKAIFSNTLQ